MVKFIQNCPDSIKISHLTKLTPTDDKLRPDDPNWKKPRGVHQRNVALEYLIEHHQKSPNGLVYFMDDDNTYSVRIFAEMRKVPMGKVGVWPVGIVGKLRYEGPVCAEVCDVLMELYYDQQNLGKSGKLVHGVETGAALSP